MLTAVIAGAATPGGPVVGFSIGAVAMKVGGGPPQVIAYVVAWALFAFQRMILWEIPFMPARFVWFRAAVSLPFPFLAAAIADGDRAELVYKAPGHRGLARRSWRPLILASMTRLLEVQAVQAVSALPDEAQDDLARILPYACGCRPATLRTYA